MSGSASGGHFASPIDLFDAVRRRATEAVLSQSGLNHPDLAREIRRLFGSDTADAGTIVQQPVLEAAFPYLAGTKTLSQLSGTLLDPRVVNALTVGSGNPDYAFPEDLRPYLHQLEAWKLLTAPEPRSVVVTSGTGSGKTECFLVPLLNDLAREAADGGRLSGVRAIALYPLNALIASQEERLRAWTEPFKGAIRFGLYNGLMEKSGREDKKEQVKFRETLRADPPPILVTNVTMLEYMTVRREDKPLIAQSRGKLRWIILDEAHSYVGSAAAEIALLIRRVLHAFQVQSTDVRFVATSATIGDGVEVLYRLKRFLADVAGLPEAQVHVVTGRRISPVFGRPSEQAHLTEVDLGDRAALIQNPVVQNIVRRLDQGPVDWPEFERATAPAAVGARRLLEALTRHSPAEPPVVPVRVHGFMRAVPGLWTCMNPACPGKPGGDWPFGAVLTQNVPNCPSCEACVLELLGCAECGEPYASAIQRGDHLRQERRGSDMDEFAASSDAEPAEAEHEPDGADDAATAPETGFEAARLFSVRSLPHGRPLYIVPADGLVCDAPDERTVTLQMHEHGHRDHCPACGSLAREDRSQGSLLRPFRYGAPFLIGNALPIVLDGVPARETGTPLPAGGRQVLSFTDSRQGTARFAASIQGAAERNHVRAVIYHAVQDSMRPPAGNEERVGRLNDEIKALVPVADAAPQLSNMLAEKRLELHRIQTGSHDGIAWATLRNQIAARTEIHDWMRMVWQPRDRRFDEKSSDFAEFLMLRELARRPRRANSLETLGLARLRFAVIDEIRDTSLPRALQMRGRSIDDWRNFLSQLLNTHVRNRLAFRVALEDARWLIREGFPHILLPPQQPKTMGSELAWPFARPLGRQATAVSLLERGLGISVASAEDRTEINETLHAAWQALLPLFQQPGAGQAYGLDLSQAHVAPVLKAHLCPVSRRLLDRSFLGLSPYGLTDRSRLAGTPCEPFDMPRHPNPHLHEAHGGSRVVEDWLEADPTVKTLRQRGLWGNLHDRIALGAPYFRAAEHSAQQPSSRLRAYERDFKAGTINVLNCSTTMEMGVDIGSVSAVMMTNVPPAIANYRQRVGRAGRRGQGVSMSLTYARDTPLDRETFRNPLTYLARRTEAPRVSLESQRIVQRHVNALLLSTWFAEAAGQALKTKTGDFFGCPSGALLPTPATWPSADFRAWLEFPGTNNLMRDTLATLVKGTVLAGSRTLLADAATAFETAETEFRAEWKALRMLAAGLDPGAARQSVEIQLTRMCGEYLLGDLAKRSVLPGHGFPTAVVPFVNTDIPPPDEVRPDGETNRFQRRSYPSRSLDLAIREYAPGADVVIDGLVYTSAGLTLNWKRPAGEGDVSEVQSLKWFWTCPTCDNVGISHVQASECDSCGGQISVGDRLHFIEPSGFTADMAVKPHAEIEHVAYVEPRPPRVSARKAPWQPFLNPERGRMRACGDGLVFYASAAGDGHDGYAICLHCGRAEAEPPEHDPTVPLAGHKPLRFTRAGEDGLCPGNGRGFTLQRHLALGHGIATDVTEIQPAALSDPGAAWALASALREALARRLGVETSELGLSVEPRIGTLGERTCALLLFDKAAGGAGFALRILDLFDACLDDARAILDCTQPGCTSGCSACILARDMFGQAELLDRIAALRWVEAEIAAVARPQGPDALHPEAKFARNVADNLASLPRGVSEEILIWADDTFQVDGLVDPHLDFLFERVIANGHKVSIVIPAAVQERLDSAERLTLRDIAIRRGLTVAEGSAPVVGEDEGQGAAVIASLRSGLVWISRDREACCLSGRWGIGQSAPVVCFQMPLPMPILVPFEALLPRPGMQFTEIIDQLSGSSRDFSGRFAGLVRDRLQLIGSWKPGQLAAVDYFDRYVNSPLQGLLAVSAAARLAEKIGGIAPIPFGLHVAPLRTGPNGNPCLIQHDWRDETVRSDVLSGLAAKFGLLPGLDVGLQPHSRRLILTYSDGSKATLVLDQGFGFLRPPDPTRVKFDFHATATEQTRLLHELDFTVAASGPSHIVFTAG